LLFACVLAAASAGPVRADEAKPGEQTERHLSTDQPFQTWSKDPKDLDSQRGDRLETRQVAHQKLETIKLKNVIPPIRFESGVAKIPHDAVDKLAKILESMR